MAACVARIASIHQSVASAVLYSGASPTVGEAVRQHAAIDEAREGAQHAGGQLGTPRGQRQAGQRDHRVAAPVAEPRIAGDDRHARGLVGQRTARDELVGGQHEVANPGGRLRGAGPGGRAAREQIRLVRGAAGPGGLAVGGRRRLGRDHDGERGAGTQRGAQGPGVQVVVLGIQAALVLAGQREAAVPGVLGARLRARRQDRHGVRALEGDHAETAGHRRHLHPPAVAAGGGVIVAVVHERAQGEGQRPRGTEDSIGDVRRVRAGLHPHPLLEERVGAGVDPHRRGALEAEALEVSVAVRRDRAVGPAVGGKRVAGAAVLDVLFELGDDEGAAQRRLQRGDEQPVVTTGQAARHRAGRETAETIGAEPLATVGRRQIAADLAAPVEQPSPRRPRCGASCRHPGRSSGRARASRSRARSRPSPAGPPHPPRSAPDRS